MSERERIRRKICSIALKNAWDFLRRSNIDNMSWALILGWRRARVGGLRVHYSKIKGTSFERRQQYLRRLSHIEPKYICLYTVRQYDSEFDRNAIELHVSVNDSKSVCLGFVSKELAREISPFLDQGCWLVCMLETITGGGKKKCGGMKKYGANYSFSLIHT